MSKTIEVSIKTASGCEIEAEVTTDHPDTWVGARVEIHQDGSWAGNGRWSGALSGIQDCSARLGADDGSETEEAYEALDAAILEAQ